MDRMGGGRGSQVSGIGHQASGIRHRVSGVRCQASGVRCQVTGIGHQVSGIGCLESTDWTLPESQLWPPATWCPFWNTVCAHQWSRQGSRPGHDRATSAGRTYRTGAWSRWCGPPSPGLRSSVSRLRSDEAEIRTGNGTWGVSIRRRHGPAFRSRHFRTPGTRDPTPDTWCRPVLPCIRYVPCPISCPDPGQSLPKSAIRNPQFLPCFYSDVRSRYAVGDTTVSDGCHGWET